MIGAIKHKYHGNFTPSSSQQRRIGCFPVPHSASISWSGIHVCPIRSDQFLITRERKLFRSEGRNGVWEWYCTIGVHLAKKNDVTQFQCSVVKSVPTVASTHYVYQCKVYFTYNTWLHTVFIVMIYIKGQFPGTSVNKIYYTRTEEWKAGSRQKSNLGFSRHCAITTRRATSPTILTIYYTQVELNAPVAHLAVTPPCQVDRHIMKLC